MWSQGKITKVGTLRFILDDSITNDHFDFSLAGICTLSSPFVDTAAIALGIHPSWSIYQDRKEPNKWNSEPDSGWKLLRIITNFEPRKATNAQKLDNKTGGYSHYGKSLQKHYYLTCPRHLKGSASNCTLKLPINSAEQPVRLSVYHTSAQAYSGVTQKINQVGTRILKYSQE